MKRMDLKAARLRVKPFLSQGRLAEISGVDQPTISRLESGDISNPTFDTVVKLAKALDIDPRVLLFGQESIAS